MRRMSPVSILWVALIAVIAVGCSSDSESTTTTVAQTDTTASQEAAETTQATPETTAGEATVGGSDATDTTVEPVSDPAADNAEVIAVCDAYVESISFGTIESGLDKLIGILGPDAPPGVQSALDTLVEPEGDIEGYFQAQNTVDGYVLPICRDRFSASIVPASDDAAAADQFLGAIRDGDRPAAERLAPTNVIVSFDWNGFPDATADFSPDNSTVSMLLEPTVTVFCQLSAGAVESCSFGE